jgi:hypothetical protein
VTAAWQIPDGGDLTSDPVIVNWQPGASGNSPIDEYQVKITGSDGTFTQIISVPTQSAIFTSSPQSSWTVTVQAHNAAGWGPWSTAVQLGGL